jgi:hypothetical protein
MVGILCSTGAIYLAFGLGVPRLGLAQEAVKAGSKAELIEFMAEFKRHAEADAFADPDKLNTVMPMTIEWRPPEEVRGDAPWVIARSVVLKGLLFRPDQIRYRVRASGRWMFGVNRVNEIACVGFDEVIAVWGPNYQIAPMLHRHYPHLPPGTPIARPGPQKMAGEGLIYKLSDSNAEKRMTLGFSFNGCVESFGASRTF